VAIRLVNHRLRQSQLRSGEGLEEVHARLAEIDQLNQRINELEERVDFTERLLATRSEEPRQLP
jgi:DNA-binding PadR family transcriptional regulator